MIGDVGMPPEDRDTVLSYLARIIHLYVNELGNSAGGSLHIVLSDHNLEAGDVEFCLHEAEKLNDHVGVAIAKCLLEVTFEDRVELWNWTHPKHQLDADGECEHDEPVVGFGALISIKPGKES